MRAILAAAALLFAAAAALPFTVHAAPPAGAVIAQVVPHCAASIEAAARNILAPQESVSNEGYRVQDLVVDPILRRAYLRVADCHDARKPLTLVPLAANLAALSSQTDQPAPPATMTLPERTASPAQVAAPMLIARGEAVEVLVRSASVHMTLKGHATAAAAAGADVDVVLDAAAPQPGEPAEPARHLTGTAAGPHRVEVQQ